MSDPALKRLVDEFEAAIPHASQKDMQQIMGDLSNMRAANQTVSAKHKAQRKAKSRQAKQSRRRNRR